MIRWGLYLLACLVVEALAVLLAPVLPLLANEAGWLPRWLWWFQTPDNSIHGDAGHALRWAGKSHYLREVAWLLRNRAYGFKWTTLSAPMDKAARVIDGDTRINRNDGRFGLLRITMGPYWQWKLVKPIGFGWCVMLNFGWLLDDGDQARALYLFSPRMAKIK